MTKIKDSEIILEALNQAEHKDGSKFLRILLIKGLMCCVILFFLLGLIVLVRMITLSLHPILSFVLMFSIPSISSIVLCALLLKIPFFQLPRTKEAIYVQQGKVFFCSQEKNKYHVTDKYYYINNIKTIKKHPFVWSITCDASYTCYEGSVSKSQYLKTQKEKLTSLVDKQTTTNTIQIGRLYNKQTEHQLEQVFTHLSEPKEQ